MKHVIHFLARVRRSVAENLVQFVMITIAVFLGFLADDYRSELVDRRIERQLVGNVVRDVREDMALATFVADDLERRAKQLDTLIRSFHGQMNGTCEMYFAKKGSYGGYEDFYRSSTSFDQLRSGGFRLIRRPAAMDSIQAYDLSITDMVEERSNLSQNVHNLWDDDARLLNAYLIDSLKSVDAFHPDRTPLRQYLVSDSPEVLTSYFTRMKIVRANFNGYKRIYRAQVARGERLIATLQQEYEL